MLCHCLGWLTVVHWPVCYAASAAALAGSAGYKTETGDRERDKEQCAHPTFASLYCWFCRTASTDSLIMLLTSSATKADCAGRHAAQWSKMAQTNTCRSWRLLTSSADAGSSIRTGSRAFWLQTCLVLLAQAACLLNPERDRRPLQERLTLCRVDAHTTPVRRHAPPNMGFLAHKMDNRKQ